MTSYFVNDVPSAALSLQPERDGGPVLLSNYTGAQISVDGHNLTTTINDARVVGTWPSTTLFNAEGLYPVTVILTGTGGKRETYALDPIVVEEAGAWYTLERARSAAQWASQLSDVDLYTLLSGAKLAVLEFAPELDDDQPVPLHYVAAQLMQARNSFNAGTVSSDGSADSPFTYAPRPLDWHVQQLLRPKKGVPILG